MQTGEVIPAENATEIEIVALYPNTVHDQNRGEFIVAHVPNRTHLSDWRFRDDGSQWAKPPPVEVEGMVAFSHEPNLAKEYLDIPVYPLEGWLQLAVDGETVTLEIDDTVVDEVSYSDRAPQAHLWVRGGPDHWVHLGETDFEPVDTVARAQTFVLPDSPEVITELLEGATHRIYLGGYELGDPTTTEALIGANERGVEVAVHAEGRPVGGISLAYGQALDALEDAGISVTVHAGAYRRYGFHHPKYIVVDDRVLITTENFKPAGTGGLASRGWGVVFDAPDLADAVAAVFHADATWRDAISWDELRDDVNRFQHDGTIGSFEQNHPPLELDSVEMTLVVAPDTAEVTLTNLIDGAEESIHIKQVRISDIDFPLMASALDRARAGAQVRILLSDRWYVREENEAFAAAVEELATADDLDIEVALVDDTERFDRIHAKGIIVDERSVVIGSINWNNHSLRENRELAAIVHDERAAAFYLAVFEGDWPPQRGLIWRVPIGLVVATLAIGALAAMHAYRLRVEGTDAASEESYTERPD